MASVYSGSDDIEPLEAAGRQIQGMAMAGRFERALSTHIQWLLVEKIQVSEIRSTFSSNYI